MTRSRRRRHEWGTFPRMFHGWFRGSITGTCELPKCHLLTVGTNSRLGLMWQWSPAPVAELDKMSIPRIQQGDVPILPCCNHRVQRFRCSKLRVHLDMGSVSVHTRGNSTCRRTFSSALAKPCGFSNEMENLKCCILRWPRPTKKKGIPAAVPIKKRRTGDQWRNLRDNAQSATKAAGIAQMYLRVNRYYQFMALGMQIEKVGDVRGGTGVFQARRTQLGGSHAEKRFRYLALGQGVLARCASMEMSS